MIDDEPFRVHIVLMECVSWTTCVLFNIPEKGKINIFASSSCTNFLIVNLFR